VIFFYGASQFHVRSHERTNIGCAETIITCFINRAKRVSGHYVAVVCTDVRNTASIRSFDRHIARIHFCARTCARRAAPRRAAPMTRICMHMSNTGTETDGKSLLRARAEPIRPLCRTLRDPSTNQRVIYRKCNRRCSAIDRAERRIREQKI